MYKIALAIVALAPISAPAQSQSAPSGSVITVERAVPFGTTPGKLLLLGNYLVFVEDQQPAASFVVPRANMEDLAAEGATITIRVREPLPGPSGPVSRFIFRAAQPTDTAVATGWYAKAGSALPATPGTSASTAGTESYTARHDHLRGSCKGRLFVSPTQLNYESVDDLGHSRRWEYKSIKEIAQKNPYELEVKPFVGGGYKVFLDGSGMSPAAFKTLVDRVTSARSAN